MKVNNFFKLIMAVGISELAGIIGSVFTISAIPTWYVGLLILYLPDKDLKEIEKL